MGINISKYRFIVALAKRVAKSSVGLALMGVASCQAITPSSYFRLEPSDVVNTQDPNQADTSRPRSGPRYVLVSLGREERWKIGNSKETAKIKALIGPELEQRGWCPDSYDILERTVSGPGDGGLQFIIKCR